MISYYLSILLCHHILNRRTQSSVINTTVVLLCSGGYLSNYYEFVGVQSCEEVFTLYILIWMLTGLNLVAFFTGILNTAVLGSIKDLVRHTHTRVQTQTCIYKRSVHHVDFTRFLTLKLHSLIFGH